jgi:hypothetical protein
MSNSTGTGLSRPTLLNSCAAAATAAEARFRIDAGPRTPRATRVVALDAEAARLLDRLAARDWPGAVFMSYVDSELHNGHGPVPLESALAEADFVMMVATAADGASGASEIGMACTLRGIMTAGLVVGDRAKVSATVSALRPHARVLLVTDDAEDVDEILSAVGG